jgi:hypothetical protein
MSMRGKDRLSITKRTAFTKSALSRKILMIHLARLVEKFFRGEAVTLGQVCQPLSPRQAISQRLLAPALQYSAITHPVGTLRASTNCSKKRHTIPKDVIVSRSLEGACPKILQGAGMSRSLPIFRPLQLYEDRVRMLGLREHLWSCFASPPGMFQVSDKAGPFITPSNSWS